MKANDHFTEFYCTILAILIQYPWPVLPNTFPNGSGLFRKAEKRSNLPSNRLAPFHRSLHIACYSIFALTPILTI